MESYCEFLFSLCLYNSIEPTETHYKVEVHTITLWPYTWPHTTMYTKFTFVFYSLCLTRNDYQGDGSFVTTVIAYEFYTVFVPPASNNILQWFSDDHPDSCIGFPLNSR